MFTKNDKSLVPLMVGETNLHLTVQPITTIQPIKEDTMISAIDSSRYKSQKQRKDHFMQLKVELQWP